VASQGALASDVRRRAKTDANQSAIVAALRDHGAFVQSLATIGDGCPDLLVGWRGRIILMELKRNEKALLKPAQHQWATLWNGGPLWVVIRWSRHWISCGGSTSER
jgi:hypothetical protein